MAKPAVSDWDETAASNTDVGSINIDEGCPAPNMNNMGREIMSQIAKWSGDDTIASASTTDLSTVPGMYVNVTGTTTITAFGTVKAGWIKFLKFAGALTLTHNGTSLILPGAANITTAAGDTAVVVSEGSGNWRCLSYELAADKPFRYSDWVTYTPTFTAFGTVASTSSWWKRIGDTLYLQIKFTAGTPTATEARISLPSGLTIDSTKVPGVRPAGVMTTNGSTGDNYFPLITGGNAYLTVSRQSSTLTGLQSNDGDELFGAGTVAALTAEVPVTGW